MKCRKNCGACCIVPSISTPLPGMPGGKPAGVRCIHLLEDLSCGIYERRPSVCRDYLPEPMFCGNSSEEAMSILAKLEDRS